MVSYKNYFGSLFRFILISVMLISCSGQTKQEALAKDAKITRTDKNVERLEKEYSKMKIFNVKKRYAHAYYYEDGSEKKSRLIEEISFDEKGNRIEHIKYTKEVIDYRFVYEYDDQDKLLVMKSFNADGNLMMEKQYIYDEEGRNTLINEIDHFNPRNTNHRRFNYNDSLVTRIQLENERFEIIADEIITYDTLGYKIAETKSEPNSGGYSVFYTHDDYGNISEIVAPFYKIVFSYDEKGNVITEELFSTQARQHKYVYHYDEDGLLLERIRYDNKEEVVLKHEFKYDFY